MHRGPTTRRPLLTVVVGVAVLLTACGGATDTADADDAPEVTTAAPSVVVTTSVLGDVVGEVLDGTDAAVEVLMPPGTDPHGYAPSAADGVALREADLVVAVGLGLEDALLDTIAAAEEDGVDVLRVAEQVDPIPYDGPAHGDDAHADEAHAAGAASADDDHADEAHADDAVSTEDQDHAGDNGQAEDETHAEDGDHAHDGLDPHVWLDPVRAGRIAEEVAVAYAEVAPQDREVVTAAAQAYVERMAALDDDLRGMVETVPVERRSLVTNHDSLGYLAERYGFEVVATVLPGTSTDVDVTAADFAELVTLLEDTGVPAVFAETTSTDRLARALAAEVPGVEVGELYTDALGEPGSDGATLEGMLRTDVERIVDALG